MPDVAASYLRAGLCVLPAVLAEKRPALAGWKQYQQRLPTERQVAAWFADNPPNCVLTGAVSGNLEMIDFDHEGELFEAWRELVVGEAPGLLDRLVVEQSQSGGRHVVYRCETPPPGNRKLAQRIIAAPSVAPLGVAGKRYVPRKVGDLYEVTLTLIETRGEGGLFLCAPSPGYQLEQGSFASLPILTQVEQSILIEAACALNEVVPPPERPRLLSSASGRPGDDFNDRGDVRDLLQRHGWQLVRAGENEYWRRPGKEQGWSATLRDRTFYVFSSNAAPFESERAYAPFSVYSLLEHNGDFGNAAAALRSEGFGEVSADDDVDLSHLVCNGAAHAPPDSQPHYPDPGPLPPEMFRVPGFVSEVMDHCLATAPYPNAPLAFCGAVALQAFLAGRKVRDSGDNRTNIYLLGLAHSAAGKDWPRKVNTRILHEVGLTDGLGERFASGEGMQDALFQSPSMLFQTDEIDGLLTSINKAKDARHEAIMGTLLTMYSAANSVFPMRRKASKQSPGVIDQPCLVILGTAIPTHYYEALSERMLTNGLFARMIIVEAGRRGSGQEPVLREPPPSILETAAWWANYQPGSGRGNLLDVHPVPAIVPHTAAARDVLVAAREEAEAEYARAEATNDAVGATVWGRASEQTRKLALLYAISENHVSPTIDLDAVQWASRFVTHQTRRMLFMAAGHVAETPFHAECLKLVRKLGEAPQRQLPHSVLLKRMKLDAKTFLELIATLEQQGDVETVLQSTAGRPQRHYRLAGEVAGSG